MEEIITKVIEIVVVGTYKNSELLTIKTLSWLTTLLILNLAVSLMNTKPEDPNAKIKSLSCIILFCSYLLCGMVYSFLVLHYIWFILSFSITSILIVLRYSPPFLYEKKGTGGIFRFILEGVCWITVHSFALSDDPGIVIFEYMPVYLVYEAWYLTKELQEAANDIKNKSITTAILMGKQGWKRIFVLIHLFCFIYLIFDSSLGIGKGLPLLLLPWTMYQIKYIKTMSNQSMKVQSFLYFICFASLTAAGVKLDYHFNG